MQSRERLESAQQEGPARPHLHKADSGEQLLGISCHSLASLPGQEWLTPSWEHPDQFIHRQQNCGIMEGTHQDQ